MLKIWGRASSVNVQKVLWAADELGLGYEHITVGGRYGGNDTPDYRAMNPNGLVPVLQESDGSTHWESNSVVRYLAAKYDAEGRSLWLADPGLRSQADRWMDWASSLLGEPMRALFWGFVRDPVNADLNAMAKAEVQAADYWARLDAHLGANVEKGRPFVAGDRLTIGDIPAACQLQRWLNFPITRPQLPHLLAWHARMTERPGYQAHVMPPME